MTMNMSLVKLTITIGGHLFDTKGFNNVLDMCEKYNIKFKVTNWDIGNNTDSPSQVSIALTTDDRALMNDCIKEIKKIADHCQLEL